MADIVNVIDAIIQCFKICEEKRRNKQLAEYLKVYREMEYIWRNNTEKLRELEDLRDHMYKTKVNFENNMNYIPPALQSKNYPIHYKRMIETQVPTAFIDSYDINLHGSVQTVHVPQLPPISQYNSILARIDNTQIYSNLNTTYTGMIQQHNIFEQNFKNIFNNARLDIYK